MITEEEALKELRRRHASYVERYGSRFAHCLFSNIREVPGWIYEPMKDRVIADPIARAP